MGTPYLSELRLVSFNYAPKNWTMCNGQILSIQQNQAIFALLGTTYGGNGQTTFALPDLRGRTPVSQGNGYTMGQKAGEENHTLVINEVPTHTHLATAVASNANATSPSGNYLAATSGNLGIYAGANNLVAMNAGVVQNTGASQPHPNLQPYLVMNWIIALSGIFPSQN